MSDDTVTQSKVPERDREIGQNIRLARIAANMSARTLARALGHEGVDAQDEVTAIELGHRAASLSELQEIRRTLRISFEFLMFGVEHDFELEHEHIHDDVLVPIDDALAAHPSRADQSDERWYLRSRLLSDPHVTAAQLELALLGYRAQQTLSDVDLAAFARAVRQRRAERER